LGDEKRKLGQIIWAILFRKKCTQRQKNAPKRRSFAQSDHTARNEAQTGFNRLSRFRFTRFGFGEGQELDTWISPGHSGPFA
jgi:hypothetical protein